MNGFELNWIVLSQRTIELLAFYLILANVYGKDLKEAFVQLVFTKQKVLYGNIIISIIYLFSITFIIQLLPVSAHGYLIDQLLRPVIAFFLLRRAFSLKKALFTFLFSMGIGFAVSMLTFFFSTGQIMIQGVLVFLLNLSVVIFMSDKNYFENIYVRLLKRKWLANSVSILSFVLYCLPFLIENLSISIFVIFPTLTLLLFFLITVIFIKKETTTKIEQLKNATPEEFLQRLEELSSEYFPSNLLRQYIIKNHNVMDIVPSLSKELDTHKMLQTFRDYECIVTKRQIKINVIL